MKNLLIALVLFISVSVSGQNRVVNLTQWNFDTFSEKCLNDLKIDSTVIVIYQNTGLILGEYKAMVRKSGNVYNITISGNNGYSDALKCLSHEIYHIHQYEIGSLKIIGKNTIRFDDIYYDVSVKNHYYDPQEVEAQKEGLLLFKKYSFILSL